MRLIKKGARNASNSDTFWQVDDIYVIVTTQVWRMMMNMNMEKDDIVVKQAHNRDKDLSMMILLVLNGGEIKTKIQY